MKAPFSPYLDALAPKMKKLVELLGKSFAYVSVLSTDSVGFSVYVSQTDKGISGQNMTTERGNGHAGTDPMSLSQPPKERKADE